MSRTFYSLLLALFAGDLRAESPFFVTYTHQMEEPGNLELAVKNVTAKPNAGNRFFGNATELEYGVKGWWTSELYFDGQATRNARSRPS